MTGKTIKVLLLALAMSGLSAGALADDTPIYGSQLMTNQERIEHRNQLRAAKSAEEREQIRLRHHEQMQLRAKERGVALPDTPPAQGGGMGRQMGPGGGMGGMGPGGGMGGPGRNR
jgi:hypothetical protein